MKKLTPRFVLCMLLSFCMAIASAQQRTITGTVKDDKGNPVARVSFLVKGTNNGGITDDNGNFSITVPDANAILIFTSVGYQEQEVAVGQNSTLSVTLNTSEGSLSEVVVTALGIQRQKKSLGYAIQEVKGETL